jgi:hypothetical protein
MQKNTKKKYFFYFLPALTSPDNTRVKAPGGVKTPWHHLFLGSHEEDTGGPSCCCFASALCLGDFAQESPNSGCTAAEEAAAAAATAVDGGVEAAAGEEVQERQNIFA